MGVNRSTWLIARALWLALLVVVLVFFGLNFVFRVLDEIKGPHSQYLFTDALLVSLTGMPRRLYLDLPLMVLIAVAAGLGGLAQSSELTALRAAGLSVGRIFTKALLALSPVLVGALVVAEVGMPQAEQFSQAYRDSKTTGTPPSVIWTREDGQFLKLTGRPSGELANWVSVELYEDRNEIRTVIEANTVQWMPEGIQLTDATSLMFGSERIVSETATLEAPTALDAEQVRWLVQTPEALALSDLWAASEFLSNEGLNARAHSQLFWQRMLLPVTLVVLAMLASATAFGSLRSLSLSSRVFLAVLLGLVFKYAMDMASPAVFLAGWHPAFAIVLPLVIPLALMPRLLRAR